MKKIFTSAFVLLLTVGAVNAQTISNPSDGKKHEKHQMKEHDGKEFKKLNLTADQKTQLKKLRDDLKTQMQALDSQNLSEADKQAKRKELHEQFKIKAESILTAEQKAQLAQSKADFKDKRKDDRKGNRGEGFGRDRADIAKELNLTADQQQKMQQLRADFKAKAEALRNESLTQDQRKAKMHELMKQQQEQMKSILTKEQLEKMQSLRKDRMNRDSK